MMTILKKSNFPYLIALILFLLSAIYGVLIRLNFVFPIDNFNYKNFLQSHSHVAFLGWGYVAVVGAIMYCFLPKSAAQEKLYNQLIWLIIVTVFLMLISFPLVGYKVFSIVLLCLFGITSYVLSFQLLKDLKGSEISVKLVRSGIYYYFISSLATWFLPYVLITQGKTNLYYNTVYFYLHFLYNGFFVFVLFGLLFKLIEKWNVKGIEKYKMLFFVFLNLACIPAYVLSILWSSVSINYNFIGFVAAILQLISLIYLYRIFGLIQLKWQGVSKLLFKFGMVAYTLKVVFQILSAIPYFVSKSLALKPFFIIGYLHLFTLAFMSVFIFLILNEIKKVNIENGTSKIGIFLFFIGVVFTEVLLFLQGFLILLKFQIIGGFQKIMLIASLLIVVGLIFIVIHQFKQKSVANA